MTSDLSVSFALLAFQREFLDDNFLLTRTWTLWVHVFYRMLDDALHYCFVDALLLLDSGFCAITICACNAYVFVILRSEVP
jgi:hypothetical protein